MVYEVIFTDGLEDELDYQAKELRCDVLLLDEKGNYYNPQFITLERITNEFDINSVCYLEENLVILRQLTKDDILKSIPQLYKWEFHKHWRPLPMEQLEKYFYPINNWEKILVED